MTIKEKHACIHLVRKYLRYELIAVGGIAVIYFAGWVAFSMKAAEIPQDWMMFPLTDYLQSMLCVFLLFFYSEFRYFTQNGVTRLGYWKARMLAACVMYMVNVVTGSIYYFVFQQFTKKSSYLLNVFSVSDVSDLPFAVAFYFDAMMTAMLIGCVFSMLDKCGKMVLALVLAGFNALFGVKAFSDGMKVFMDEFGGMTEHVHVVLAAVLYAVAVASICLLLMRKFRLRD